MIRVEQDSLHAIILFLCERGKRHRLLIRYGLIIFLSLFFFKKCLFIFQLKLIFVNTRNHLSNCSIPLICLIFYKRAGRLDFCFNQSLIRAAHILLVIYITSQYAIGSVNLETMRF